MQADRADEDEVVRRTAANGPLSPESDEQLLLEARDKHREISGESARR
jgi:hypothetical protein